MNQPQDVLDRLEAVGVVPVVVLDCPADAVSLVHTLHAAGLDALEVTVRTPAALEAIEAAAGASEAVVVGAGTVLTADQVMAVHRCGAAFAVAPGLDRASMATASSCGLPFVPGVVTPTEAMAAMARGVSHLKFFPAAASGGVAGLHALASPLAHTGVRFMPTGGVDLGTAADYLAHPGVFAVGGTWIAPREDIRRGAWGRIEARARAAVELVTELRRTPRHEDIA